MANVEARNLALDWKRARAKVLALKFEAANGSQCYDAGVQVEGKLR